jgi:hypothetical protein
LDTLQSVYDPSAASLVNRPMVVPANALTEAIEVACETPMCGKSPPICTTTATSSSFSKAAFSKNFGARNFASL